MSELETEALPLQQLETRYTAWIGSLDVEALISRSELAREHAFGLRKAAEAARHQMGEAEESLAAGLGLSGSTAWSKLHGNVSSQLVVPVALPAGRRGPGGEPAHERRAGPGPRPRRASTQGRVRGRAGRLEDGGGAPRRRLERDQGGGEHAQRPPGLAGRPGPGPVPEQRRPPDAGGDAAGLPGIVPGLPALPAHQGPPAGPGAPALVGPVRPGGRGGAGVGLRRGGAVRGGAVRDLLPGPGRAGPAGGRGALDRRRAPGREARRGLLHGPAPGRVARLPQLRAVFQQRADPGPRAGPRLPQRAAGATHADAAPDPHAPGGDGQHLLPDHRHQRRAGHGAGRGEAGHPGRQPAGCLPGGGGHPLPVPVRVRPSSSAAPGGSSRWRS